MAQITTFAQACKKLGIAPKTLPDTSGLLKHLAKGTVAHYKLMVIVEALNDGWKPDWNNSGQPKYFPWFDMEKDKNNPIGFRLSVVLVCCTYSYVGSRLCFQKREVAEYAAKTFLKLYRDYFLF